MTKNEIDSNFEKFLNPSILQENLVIASLFIAVFDNFKTSIIKRVKDFYIIGFDNGKYIYSKYEQEVLNKVNTTKNNTLVASLNWLKEYGALGENDLIKFQECRDMRNKLAHEMTTLLYEGFDENIYILYFEMLKLFKKIDQWWIINIDMVINPPNIPYRDIQWEQIKSVNIEFLELMSEIALTKTDIYLERIKNFVKK